MIRGDSRRLIFVVLLSVTIGSVIACGGTEEIGDLAESALDEAGTQQVVLEQELTQEAIDSGQVVQPDQEGTGGEDLWRVFFTDPVMPFNDVTTGGVDDYLNTLIDSAQYSIDLAVFEFNLQQVADALIAAHQRGVQVRIVYDDEHTEEDPQIEELLDAGIPAVPDERSAFMHNKFWVFDSSIVWTGSTNITENGFYRNNNNVIVFYSPELAQNYTTEFSEMFNGEFGPRSPANTPYPGALVGEDIWVETYFAPEDDVLAQVVSLVHEAEYSVHFMAFAFTEDALGDAMLQQATNGVEVSGVFEARGANTEYSECPRLLANGLDVRLDGNPSTFHHKVIIIDGQIVATGSFNFSNNATTTNDENMLIIHSPVIASYYEDEFYRRSGEANLPVGGECLAE